MSFRGEIQANTEITEKIGPFLDKTNGDDAEDSLSIAQADIRVSKNGGNFAQVNHNQGGGNLTHDELGYYGLTLDTTDTNTEGRLLVAVHESGALLVELTFNVLSQAAWKSKYDAKDAGYMDINIKTIGRADTQETETNNLESACSNYSVTRGLTGTALPAAAADAAGGLPISDAGGLDMDNLKAEIDGLQGTDGKCLISTDAQDLNATLSVNVKALGASTQSLTDLKDFADTGYDPATHKVQGVVLTDTTTTNSDMRGTDSAALASVVGALDDAAAAGDPTNADTLVQYIKQVINILIGTDGIGTFPAEAAPANAVSLAEVIRAIHADVTGLNGEAMRGTDGANTTVPDAAGTAPTAAEIKTAIEAAGSDLDHLCIALINKKVVEESNGNLEQFNDAGASIGTINTAITSDGTYTTQLQLVQ